MVAFILIGGAVVLLVALHLFIKQKLTYWKKRNVPFAPPSSPFGNYGPAILGKCTMPQVAHALYEQYRDEKYIGTYFSVTPLLQIHDPEILRHVFVKEFQDFNGRGMYCDTEVDPLSGHLFILSGQPWRNLRVKLSPTFTTGKIKYMFQSIRDAAHYLSDHIDSQLSANGGEYEEDIRELVARFATDLISNVAFGIDSNSMKDPNSEFRRMGSAVFEPSFNVNIRNLLSFFGAPILKAFRIRVLTGPVHNFFTRIVHEALDYREKYHVERPDMLNLLIKLKNDGFVPPDAHDPADKTNGVAQDSKAEPVRQRLTEEQIAAQVFVFFVAGFETTSSTTSFTLFELSKNLGIQEKVIQEIDAVLAKHKGEITYDTLMDLHYMDMVIHETLRFYPPVPFLTRAAMVSRTLPLTDVVLEKGMRLLIPVSALHLDPKYWPEPHKFNPLRFTEEAKKSRTPMTYMPFGDGPRICIGMRLGLVQVKMALLTILSRSRVCLAPGMPRQVRIAPRSIVPAPVDGCRLVLTAR